MTTITPEGYGEASLVMTSTSGTEPFVVTCGVHAASTPDLVTVANTVFDAYANSFLQNTTHIITLEKCILLVGPAGAQGTFESDRSSQDGALSSGSFAPFSAALTIRKHTARFGRKGRGRMFIPGWLTNDIVGTDGKIISEGISQANDDATSFISLLQEPTQPGDVSLDPYLLHTHAGDDPDEITSMTAAPLIGLLRKRIR